MKAIILAAGRGSRMGNLTTKLPKCMTVLFNKKLIEWQFLSLTHTSISEIGIVTGYLKNTFKLKNSWKVVVFRYFGGILLGMFGTFGDYVWFLGKSIFWGYVETFTIISATIIKRIIKRC